MPSDTTAATILRRSADVGAHDPGLKYTLCMSLGMAVPTSPAAIKVTFLDKNLQPVEVDFVRVEV